MDKDEVTDEQLQEWADEAERGYDVEWLKERRRAALEKLGQDVDEDTPLDEVIRTR